MRSQVSRTGIGILRQLRTIRRSVSVCLSVSRRSFALVLTKLDFGNATLTGIPSFQLDRLQAIMNVAAMIISSATLLPALTSCASARIFQACRHGVPVRPWTWTGLPGRRHSASRLDSRSTTSAVMVSTERFPSPRHEHGTVCQLK